MTAVSRHRKNHQFQLTRDYDRVWTAFRENVNHKNYIQHRRRNRARYYNIILKYLNGLPAPTVLELGCGTGIDLNVIASKEKKNKYLGSDISEESIVTSLHITEKFNNSIYFFAADTRYLPLRNRSLDLIFSQGLLEHFRDPVVIVEEQVRVLKRGGILIINVPQRYTAYTFMKHKLMRQGKWELGWETEFSYKDLKKMSRELDLLEMEICGYQYWRSWWEPMFVLRDLYDKYHRRNPLRERKSFLVIKHIYDSLWEKIESKLGHYFSQNIVIVLQKT